MRDVEAEVRQQGPDQPRCATHGCEIVGRGVEIEDEPIGMARPIGAAEPHVRRDARLAREVREAL